MPTFTPKLNLQKPADAEFGWQNMIRQNADVIDAEALRVATKVDPQHNTDGTHKGLTTDNVVVQGTMTLGGVARNTFPASGGATAALTDVFVNGEKGNIPAAGEFEIRNNAGTVKHFGVDEVTGKVTAINLAGMMGNIMSPLVHIPFKRQNDEVALSGLQTYVCASASNYIDPLDGLLKAAAINTPRFVRIPDGTSGLGLLHEGTGTTNLIPATSYNLAAGWAVHGAGTSSIAQDAVGLDGVANSAVTITDTDVAATAGRKTLINTITADTSTYAFSIYVKKTTVAGNTMKMTAYMTGGTIVAQAVFFDPFLGVVDTASQAYSYVEDEGAYWRITQTVANNLNTVARIIVSPSARVTVNGAAGVALTGSVVVDYPQIELKGYSTSPIVGGSTRERSLLTIAASGNDVRAGDDYAMTMGVYILGGDTNGHIIDGSDAHFWVALDNAGTPQFRCKLHSTAPLAVSTVTAPPTPRSIMQIAVRAVNGRQSFWLNGVNVASNVIAQSGTNNTMLGIGNLDSAIGSGNSDLIIKDLRIYDFAPTDSAMAAL